MTLHGFCEAGRLVRFDAWGDVLLTKAADCKMVASRVDFDTPGEVLPLPAEPVRGRHWLYITNNNVTSNPAILYVGGRGVTAGAAGSGYPLRARDRVILEATDKTEVFGVTAAPGLESVDARVLELK